MCCVLEDESEVYNEEECLKENSMYILHNNNKILLVFFLSLIPN